MKKKISLLGLVLILILSLMGCSSKKDEAVYDEELAQQYASAVVSGFSQMSDEDLESYKDLSDYELNYVLMQIGLPVEGDDFLKMIDAWNSGEKECGVFDLTKFEWQESKVSNTGITLIASFEAENRTGTMEFAFDEKLNMESLTVNAKYSISEILTKAGLNTVLGMGTVFVVLIFISFIISLFRYIPAIEAKFKKEAKTETKAPAPAPQAAPTPAQAVAPAAVTADTELAAVIAAAIAAAEGTTTDGFIVRSIKRRKSNKWN